MSAGFPAHGGDLAWAAERYGVGREELIDFSANVNPLGPSRHALEAARAALGDTSGYPEPDAASLKRELADSLGVGKETLMLGNGSTELIHHLVKRLSPGRVLVVSPAFVEYENAARCAGAEIIHHELYASDGFSLRVEELAAKAASADIVFACNPASPSGSLYAREELLRVLSACREGHGLLAVDESFMGFCTSREAEGATLLPEAGERGLVIISTMTKLFALAGLRGPGWLAGPRELVEELEGKAVPWRINSVAIAAAGASLGDAGYVDETRRKVAAWREELSRRLDAIGVFHVFPSHANFLLLEVTRPQLTAPELAEELGRRGILVRLCHNFRGLEDGFIRVAVRMPEENERLLAALEEMVKT